LTSGSRIDGLQLAVVGAGVLGLSVALHALAAGASVTMFDPAELGDNASGVAAGMIAPVGESLFDPAAFPHLDLLRAGRDAWIAMAALAPGLELPRPGALLLWPDGDPAHVRARLRALDVEHRIADQPRPFGLSGAFTPEDHLISARAALLAMDQAVSARGGRKIAARFAAAEASAFDAVVIAAGAESRSLSSLAPEVAALTPIKGQLIRFPEVRDTGPILRSDTIYLAPQSDGLLAGATMEPGIDDRAVDPSVVEMLRRQAEALAPYLRGRRVEGLAGVRAATPDGLPMVGPSRARGVFLATGARRNGWLLAPLVGPILVSYLSGGDGGRLADRLDPRRFGF